MPYDEEGRFYTTRIGDDLKGDDPLGRLHERSVSARKGARIGATIGSRAGPLGGVIGGTLGTLSGFILGDREIVFPIDMVAIPAYQAYLLQGTPSFQIYIKEGEVLTQVQLTDAQEAEASTESIVGRDMMSSPKKKRKPSKYNKAYSKNFKKLKTNPIFTKKDGTYKKNGFKRLVKAAHIATKKEMK